MDNQFYEAGRSKWNYYLGNDRNNLPSGLYYMIMELENIPVAGIKIVRQ